MAGLNLVEALLACGQKQAAAEQALHSLEQLDRCPQLSQDVLEAPCLPPGFELFRIEWERASWSNAGNLAQEAEAKRTLLRWRLHALLGSLTGQLTHYYEAAFARFDLPYSQAALGCALARAKHIREALPYLRRSVVANPFDVLAMCALYEALGQADLWAEQHQLARSCGLLHQAAPTRFPWEDWVSPPVLAARPVTVGVPPELGTVLWEGGFHALHSLALVNRELCSRLAERGVSLILRSTDQTGEHSRSVPFPAGLTELCQRSPTTSPMVTVRHSWPPCWTAPQQGYWVQMQPWEFGSLPAAWQGPVSREVDAVWTYTSYVRSLYLQAGVPAERVHVVPLGVDVKRLQASQQPFPFRTRKRFKFLFVGGTIHRKGIDLLLSAYTRTFSRTDDVCLVIKDMGVGSFYREQTAEQAIARCQQGSAGEIEYLNEELSPEQMAALYQSCDCLVHPYRGEGFGLPIAEAMACGLPVIVTGLWCGAGLLQRGECLPGACPEALLPARPSWRHANDRSALAGRARCVLVWLTGSSTWFLTPRKHVAKGRSPPSTSRLTTPGTTPLPQCWLSCRSC